jgi:hypothetical protein
MYLDPIENAFGAEVDYAQLIKLYGNPSATGTDTPTEVRYSPPVCMGSRKAVISGQPEYKHYLN